MDHTNIILYNSGRKCCLHIGPSFSGENVILFTENSIEKCREKKEVRDSIKKKKSKFDDITLPDVIDQTTGYHASCFKSYCAVHLKITNSGTSLVSVGIENDLNEVAAASESENDNPTDCKFNISEMFKIYS